MVYIGITTTITATIIIILVNDVVKMFAAVTITRTFWPAKARVVSR